MERRREEALDRKLEFARKYNQRQAAVMANKTFNELCAIDPSCFKERRVKKIRFGNRWVHRSEIRKDFSKNRMRNKRRGECRVNIIFHQPRPCNQFCLIWTNERF